MSSLPLYTNIDEKSDFFQHEIITSFQTLIDKLIEDQKKRLFFRGMADASWKLLTSAQREWIQRDLNHLFTSFKSYVEKFLLYSRQTKHMEISVLAKSDFDISILSLLQHFGSPTPFLDFTSVFNNALFFASHSPTPYGKSELNSFFSIYTVSGGDLSGDSNNYLSNFESIFRDVAEGIESENLQNLPGGSRKDLASFNTLSKLPMVYILETSANYLKMANPRSDLQNGLFLFAGQNTPNEPYETWFSGKETKNLKFPKMKCYDIHKNLIPAVKLYLESVSCDSKALGLPEQKWGEALFEDFLIQSRIESIR
jgi:hypothetical protein